MLVTSNLVYTFGLVSSLPKTTFRATINAIWAWEHRQIGNPYLVPSIRSSPMNSEGSAAVKGNPRASAKET